MKKRPMFKVVVAGALLGFFVCLFFLYTLHGDSQTRFIIINPFAWLLFPLLRIVQRAFCTTMDCRDNFLTFAIFLSWILLGASVAWFINFCYSKFSKKNS